MTVLGFDSNSWQIFASIATIVGVFAVIVTLLAAKKQLDEMSKARTMTAFLEVHKLLESLEEEKHMRRYIYNLEGEPGKLGDIDQDKVEQLIRHVDTIAYLVESGHVELNVFLGLYFTVIGKLWNKTKPFVYFEREKRNNLDWASHFEWLGEKAEQFRAEYHPEVTFTILPKNVAGEKVKKTGEK